MLSKIQSELKAPKGQYNKFGKYKYRSAEDITEAVKPILAKYNYSLITPQTITEIGGRIYVETLAILLGEDGKEIVRVSAHAREAENRKGMDESQITGATGSYSKKYALNNLFAIDDTKDADTQPPVKNEPNNKAVEELKIILDEFDNYEDLKSKMTSLRDDYVKKGINEITAQKIIKDRLMELK